MSFMIGFKYLVLLYLLGDVNYVMLLNCECGLDLYVCGFRDLFCLIQEYSCYGYFGFDIKVFWYDVVVFFGVICGLSEFFQLYYN